jgi:hypothetical protein
MSETREFTIKRREIAPDSVHAHFDRVSGKEQAKTPDARIWLRFLPDHSVQRWHRKINSPENAPQVSPALAALKRLPSCLWL